MSISRTSLLLALFLTGISQLFAQNTLDQAGLDNTSPATVAYSMRKLSSSYAGFAIQVRRSNDHATQDIGFDANGDLDITALTSFVGSNNAFVTIWYDQSGNANNLTQSTASRQPWIVHNGVVDTENGRPFIRFYGHNGIDFDTDMLALGAQMTTTGHLVTVNKFAVGGDGFILGHTSGYDWHGNNGGGKLFYSGVTSSSIWNGSVWQNGTALSTSAAVFNTSLMVNSVAPQSPSTGTAWNNIGSDRNGIHDVNLGGGYAELITFPSMLASGARISLENNQGSYFGITAGSYLGRTGALTTAAADQINKFGQRGVSTMSRYGETGPQSVPVTPTASNLALAATTADITVSISVNDGFSTTAGICWSTSANPTIADSKTSALLSGTSLTATMTGLADGTTYYVRPYATNVVGTSYGTQLSFTHLSPGYAYQGGKVAYVLQPGDLGYDMNTVHGLIADLSDQSGKWGQEGLSVPGADGTAIGTGLQNTIDIMAGDATPGNAARLCRGVTINGYSDWYLPSKDELNKLYLNRLLIGGFNVDSGWYFSSTEGNSSAYAWYQDFSNGTQSGTGAHKDWALSVRAVRSF